MTPSNLKNELEGFVKRKRDAAQDYGEYRHIMEDSYSEVEKELSECGTSISSPQSLKFDFSFGRQDWNAAAYEELFD
jgi:hypothetical protein